MIGSLSVILNGQKRKTGDKPAWIATGQSLFSTWLHFVMVDLKSLSVRRIRWPKESMPHAKYSFISIRGHGQLRIQVSKHKFLLFLFYSG